MIQVYVQATGVLVWAAGMLLAGYLMYRPEGKHHKKRWWQKPVPWYQPDPGTLAFAVQFGVV